MGGESRQGVSPRLREPRKRVSLRSGRAKVSAADTVRYSSATG